MSLTAIAFDKQDPVSYPNKIAKGSKACGQRIGWSDYDGELLP